MKISISHSTVRLQDRQHISVIDGKGARIVCRDGRVWITQDRDANDTVLAAGQAFTLDRNGVAIIEAMGASQVVLDAPCAQPRLAAVRRARLTAQAVLGFAQRLQPASRPPRPLPVMERGSLRQALAVLGLAPERSTQPGLVGPAQKRSAPPVDGRHAFS